MDLNKFPGLLYSKLVQLQQYFLSLKARLGFKCFEFFILIICLSINLRRIFLTNNTFLNSITKLFNFHSTTHQKPTLFLLRDLLQYWPKTDHFEKPPCITTSRGLLNCHSKWNFYTSSTFQMLQSTCATKAPQLYNNTTRAFSKLMPTRFFS